MAIRYKLGLIAGGLSLIIVFMFAVTWFTTSAQKADGLVINLAGRQRMLSQKMSKELFLYMSAANEKEKAALGSSAKNTIKVFDLTLAALSDSGKAPLSLNLETTAYGFCPKAVEPAASQLEKVKAIWKPFSTHMNTVLSNKDKNGKSLKYVKANNILLLKEMNTAVGMMQKLSEKKVSRLIYLQTIGIIAGISLMILSILQIHIIVKKLMSSASTASQMSKGDLTRRFEFGGKDGERLDEISYLGKNLNIFAKSLQDNMKDIWQGASDLNSSSTDMSNIARGMSEESQNSAQKTQKVAESAENMSEDMNAVAAAMEELSANTAQIAESTSRMSDTIKEISKNSDQARDISRKAVTTVESASSRVDDLGNAAQKIGNVSESITDISEQTNLLALNATIEAARAGEAGKGFAVVAGEIKSLAGQTAEATLQIKENINWIQQSTSSTVEEISQIASVIKEVNEIVSTISSAVGEQADTVAEIDVNVSQGADAVQEVSSNVANTSAASVEISQDINGINSSISQISSSSTDISASSEKLSDLAEQLDAMVAHFKIS